MALLEAIEETTKQSTRPSLALHVYATVATIDGADGLQRKSPSTMNTCECSPFQVLGNVSSNCVYHPSFGHEMDNDGVDTP